MINENNLIEIVLNECPSFREDYEQYDNKDLLYLVAGEFSRYVLRLYKSNDGDGLLNAGKLIEKLHVNGNDYVKELATIGFLEGIQNNWGHEKIDPNEFKKYLGQESLKWWISLHKFWNQEIPYVGHDISLSENYGSK